MAWNAFFNVTAVDLRVELYSAGAIVESDKVISKFWWVHVTSVCNVLRVAYKQIESMRSRMSGLSKITVIRG
ncbi:hypothetical protein D3C86_1815380 [compost metagenome]